VKLVHWYGFRPLDNIDLAEVALPVLSELGTVVRSAELTETRLYHEDVSVCRVNRPVRMDGDMV